NTAAPGTGVTNEMWIDTRGRSTEALRKPPFAVLDVSTRRGTLAQLRADPLGRGAVLVLGSAALAALVLALAGVLLALGPDLRAHPRQVPGGVVRAVEIRDLFRVYSTPEGDAAALQGLTLAVEEHELVVVLGPSGSGKTTLLRAVAAQERPSAGVVRVFGRDAARLSGRERSRLLGYVDQHYERALAPGLTARELVALPLGLRGARPGDPGA